MKEKFVAGCKSCEEYKGKDNSKINAIDRGFVIIGGEIIDYVVVESSKKAAETHLIFTTTSHHIADDEPGVRAELNKEATLVAYKLLGPDHRMVTNSGLKASSMTHYHAHLIRPGEGQRLPRIVVNVQDVIENLDLPKEMKDSLDKTLLQQK